MAKEKLPTQAECMKLLREHGAPDNMIDHTRMVTKVAMHIGRKLKENGEKIDLDLLNRAAMLHDVAKFETLHSKKPVHHTVAEKMLRRKGYPKLAKIVRNHALETILVQNALRNWGWEEKVLHYADSRVLDNKIASLSKRLDYLRKRYGPISKKVVPKINRAEPLRRELEREILSRAGIDAGLGELKRKKLKGRGKNLKRGRTKGKKHLRKPAKNKRGRKGKAKNRKGKKK